MIGLGSRLIDRARSCTLDVGVNPIYLTINLKRG